MSAAAGFSSSSYTFDPRPAYPLLSVAKRYWNPDSPYLHDPEALTLPKIREIWALDAPNHGDSAVLNEEALGPGSGYDYIFGWEEYGRSIHLFLSGLGKGVDVDFSMRNIVGIGHSMGAISLGLSMGYYPKINYQSLILCELMTMQRELHMKATNILVNGGEKRRDIWPSKEEAYNILKSRGTWKSWDDRVLRNYVESGMHPLPTAEYPDKREGVTLKCTRTQEVACYRDTLGPRRIYNNFHNIVAQVPTHLIYGAIDDYIAAEVKDDIINNRAGGIANLASYTRVPGAGHLVCHH
ncbi:Alpha/beta hydrolase fold-1 [Gymnopilus junonius]|uniref:Alpha/beta hydrolase fold-1 n=1 Tax=Gymnopilus junonius TaxID=109634 RepID=A0A9P5P195_GYMJU|nr:Alpha/beta hydrolase fold-1 [Gymnopilus junonius]